MSHNNVAPTLLSDVAFSNSENGWGFEEMYGQTRYYILTKQAPQDFCIECVRVERSFLLIRSPVRAL